MNIAITKLRPDAQLPDYQTALAAGADLTAAIDEPLELNPGQRLAVSTGIAIALPAGYEAQVRARSGLAFKFGIGLVNGIGTIDADYRGEIKVLLINHGQEKFIIEPGMRIAQMVIARFETADWQLVETLEETERASGGFGSTGH